MQPFKRAADFGTYRMVDTSLKYNWTVPKNTAKIRKPLESLDKAYMFDPLHPVLSLIPEELLTRFWYE